MVSRDAIPVDSASGRRCLPLKRRSARRPPSVRCVGSVARRVHWYRRTRCPRDGLLLDAAVGGEQIPKSPCRRAGHLGRSVHESAANLAFPWSTPRAETRCASPEFARGRAFLGVGLAIARVTPDPACLLATLGPEKTTLRPGGACAHAGVA
jgi:hypothetical protein